MDITITGKPFHAHATTTSHNQFVPATSKCDDDEEEDDTTEEENCVDKQKARSKGEETWFTLNLVLKYWSGWQTAVG